jgi:hypothetical protein
MRIINTKEDIRQALISKGYDVPTSIPFKEYAKMISDLPCRVDSFPDIEGIVARYSALGLTNEQMKENPVWVDKTGNGHDLQMKNFAWGGMSGVGGYNQNFNQWGYGNLSTATQTHTSYKIELSVPSTLKTANIYSNANSIGKEGDVYDFTLNIVGLKDGALLRITKGVVSGVIERIEKDGIYKIYQPIEAGWDQFRIYIFISNPNLVDLNITIEQLPIYPGALVFDGVDDWAGCDNLPLLPKEKGYSIIALRNWITRYDATQYKRPLISNLDTNDEGAFLIEYRKDENVNDVTGSYNSFTDVYIDDNNPITWQTSSSYNGQIIKKGTSKSTNKLCICKTYFGQLSNYANAAIWEIVILDHDATEEELTKIKDYFVKTYPWLFFDQAWTVTGKTNEDEDRATIANLTGNGNDLVLSNFGFSGNSGYGLYNIQKFTNWNHVADRGDIVKNGYSVTITNSKITGSSTNYNTDILYSYNSSSTTIIFKVTGLVDGQKIFLGRKSVTDAYVIDKDGIYRSDYNIPQEGGKVIVGIGTVGFTGECNITIEQIPEYEGYLITDGVDDKVVSAESIAFTDTWTIITDTVFLGKVSVASGILASNIFTVYNYQGSGTIAVTMGEGGSSLRVITSSIKAFSSDGTIYDAEWNEYHVEIGTIRALERLLKIGTSSNETSYFCQLAFKFLGIYNNQILSKDDCIKAYNYLQTLKAK